MAPRVVLVGPPGAGKTTVAGVLARRWSVAARDTDSDVERSTGRSISDLFVEDGEEAFRRLESAAVLAALREHDGVLAVGGGAVLDADVRSALGEHVVAFLDVGIGSAAPRIGFNRDRPLLLGNPRAQWVRLMEARRGFYVEVATVTVDTDGRTPDEVADGVAEGLGG